MNWKRILCYAAILIVLTGIGTGWLWDLYRRDSAKSEVWISLPRSGMDASQQPTRELIERMFEMKGSSRGDETLIARCGHAIFDDKLRERYEARIGPDAWGPFWHIAFDVVGDDIYVAVTDDYPVPPPPPPPTAQPSQPAPTLIAPVSEAHFPRQSLEIIRTAWTDEALWHAPQKDAFNCLDGNPVYLEACVQGKYAARFRNCDGDASTATSKLWEAITQKLPAPQKSYWQ